MGNVFKINPRVVYEAGDDYVAKDEELKKIQLNLRKIYNNIDNAWQGTGGHNFKTSFYKHIENLNEQIDYLEEMGDILKKNALEHDDIDNEFATKMERSGADELIKNGKY